MRALKGLGWFVTIALMLMVLAFAWGRLRGPSERQAAALALFDQDMKPTKGRNAFPAIWLTNYDVPPDQVDAVYSQGRPHIQEMFADYVSNQAMPFDPMAAVAGKYSKLAPVTFEEQKITCNNRDHDCLANVRAHRLQIADLLARQSTRLQHDMALADDDFDWNDLSPSFLAVPPYGSTQNLWLTSAALDFVNGHTSVALSGVCTNALTMRRLHAHSNTLLATMVAESRLSGAASLFVHMLSELPADRDIPEACAKAFAQVEPADVDLCPSMQWEFHYVDQIYLTENDAKTRWRDQLKFSETITRRQEAAQFARLCSDGIRAQLLDDERFTPGNIPSHADFIDWISNVTGSVLVNISQPAYFDYLNRQQDGAATVRLVATILWLEQTRGQGKALEERLTQRPAWMHVAEDRDLHVSKDGRSLHMGHHGPGKSGITEWPLPSGL